MNNEIQHIEREVVKVNGTLAKVGDLSNWEGLVATFVAFQDVKKSSRKLYVKTLSQFFVWIGVRTYYEANNNGVDKAFVDYYSYFEKRVKDKKEQKEIINRYVKEKLPNLSRTDILEYKDSLFEKGLSSLTIGSYIVAVRKFYEWAEAEKLYPNIAKGVKTPRRVQAFKKQHLSDEKSQELLEYFRSLSLRDYAIVITMLYTGLRTIEITRLDVEDIIQNGKGEHFLRIWGKGHDEKDDSVPLDAEALKAIKDYLSTRKNAKAKDPLFVSNATNYKNGRLTTKSISRICKEGLVAIGLEGRAFTAHSLRHTTACALLENGATARETQLFMRHSSFNTTQIYAESLSKEKVLEGATAKLRKAFSSPVDEGEGLNK